MVATYDQSNSDSDQHQNNNQSQTDNVIRTRSGHRLSFEHSLTSGCGGGASGGVGHKSSSSLIPPVVGEGQVVGSYWESRDLSRRSNIHRSHLSSSIQTGILLGRIVSKEIDGTPPINQPTASVRAQTANLAELALQRTFSDPSTQRRPSFPPTTESYTLDITAAGLTRAPLASTSSQPVLDDLVPPASPSHRQSMLTHLLRSSPPDIIEPTLPEASPERQPSEIPQSTITRLHFVSPYSISVSPSSMSETSALLPGKGGTRTYGASETYFHSPDDDDDDDGHHFLHEHDIERQGYSGIWLKRAWFQGSEQRIRSCLKNCDRRTIWEKGVIDTIHRIPAVILGLLLNILDALSYGMILFPLGQPIFEKLGPDGISMFYVSCIISQLVYSLGGSVFKGGVGSEMVLKL